MALEYFSVVPVIWQKRINEHLRLQSPQRITVEIGIPFGGEFASVGGLLVGLGIED